MNFFKALFSSKQEDASERKQAEEEKHFDVLKYDGIRALRSNQTEYAIKCFVHSLEIKEDLEVRENLSLAYINQGSLKEAYEQLLKIARVQPDNLALLNRMANILYMMEDYDNMLDVCQKAFEIDNEDTDALYLYAKACIGKDCFKDAIEALNKIISIDPQYYEAYLLRGEIFLRQEDILQADKDATFLLEKIQESEDVFSLKARVEAAKGDTGDPIPYYDAIIDLNPFSVDAYKARAELKAKKGDTLGAEEDFSRAKEYDVGVPQEEDIEEKVKQAYNDINPIGL